MLVSQDTRSDINNISAEVLAEHGAIKLVEDKSNEYVCPFCHNGEGKDGTGIKPDKAIDHVGWKCQRCSAKFDNIAILAAYYGLNVKYDFQEICSRACSEFGIHYEAEGTLTSKATAPRKSPSTSKTEPEQIPLIKADIADAQKQLEELPENQRRGLTLETYRHFGCGFLSQWTHPKNRVEGKKTFPTRRLIVPTTEHEHYLAAMLSADRDKHDKSFWKLHAGAKKLFNPNALSGDLIIVVEGELDCMSIWQASEGNIAVVATLGASSWNNTLLPNLSNFKGKSFLILFDVDKSNTGRLSAEKFRVELLKRKIPAVFRFFDDFLTDDEKQSFGGKTVDANAILQTFGDAFLKSLTEKIIGDAQAELETTAANASSDSEEKSTRYELHPDTCADNAVRTRDRIKDCPVNLILPDDFIWTTSGITQKIPSKKATEDFKYLPVTKTPIIITKKFCEPTKGTVEFEIGIRVENKWKYATLEGRSLVDARQLTVLGDYDAIINDVTRLKQFFDALRACNPDLNEIKAYSKTGWTDDDCTEFIYPNADAPYIVRRAGFDFSKIFKPKGNAELWKQKFIEVTQAGGVVACAYFGVALSAPLAEPIIGANPSAHLFGKSGGGKTALQKFIASTFGNPRELLRTFAATNKNRLLTAAAFDGLPTFFDELETVQGKAAEEALSKDIYDFYDGKGNQANKRNGDAREIFKFRSSRLTTGERPILKQNDLRGAFKRLLPLEAKAGFLPDELAANLHFFVESNFAHFGKIWIDFVTTHKEEIYRKYISLAERYAPMKKYEPTHLKMLAAACVAFEFFSVAIGIKSSFDNTECTRIFHAITDTLPTNAELDDTARAIEELKSFVAGHERYFVQENKNNPNEEAQFAYANETYGKIFDNGEVAFYPTALKTALEENLGFASADKLINEWNDKDDVLITDAGRKTDVVKIGRKNQRVYHFCAGILSEVDDSAEVSYYAKLAEED